MLFLFYRPILMVFFLAYLIMSGAASTERSSMQCLFFQEQRSMEASSTVNKKGEILCHLSFQRN